MKEKKNILIGITGSIAAYKTYDVIRSLKKAGYAVRCVVSSGGRHFVNKLTLETILHENVYVELFGEYVEKKAVHIPLADWADVIAVVPATADIMAKMACGIADELLLSVVLASHARIVCAPAMHSNMWLNPITQENVAKLKKCGFSFVGPVEGALSDGTTGVGHIASQDAIVAAIEELLG